MARHISSEILIDRPPEVVWKILSELGRFKDWNPFMISAKGTVERGSHLSITAKANGKTFTFKPTVTDCEPKAGFSWVGRVAGLPGIFTGKHHHELRRTPEGTHYIQSEDFTGVLVPFVGKMLIGTEEAFGRMNVALKDRAERTPTQP